MAESLNVEGADEARRALESYRRKLGIAADRGVAAVALAYERELKTVLQKTQNSGKGRHIGPPGGFPNRRTGRLANSIMTERSTGFSGYSRASVGPTMVYARSLELGNPRWRSNVRYPFMEPVARVLRPHAQRIFTSTFNRNMKG